MNVKIAHLSIHIHSIHMGVYTYYAVQVCTYAAGKVCIYTYVYLPFYYIYIYMFVS